MSESAKERCMLQFSTYLALAVIGCNSIKAACMLYTTIFLKEERLATQG